jgi:hypothetical protein
VTTPGVKVLTPLPTIVQEDGEMTPAASVSPGLQRLVDQALADLVQRLAVERGEVETIEVEEVVWPDASLGCPQAGMMYAQVITPGFRVVLAVEGETYEYHTDAGRLVVLCGKDGSPAQLLIPVDPDEIKDGKPWMPVD